MDVIKNKKVSQNMNYFIEEKIIDGKKMYAIMETLKGKGGATNNYDLNLYFSKLRDAEDKLATL